MELTIKMKKPDPRQKEFYKELKKINADLEKEVMDDSIPVRMDGKYYASAADLGKIHELMVKTIAEKLKGKGIDIRQALTDILDSVVQRVVQWEITKTDSHYIVSFRTKDDYSVYHYKLGIAKARFEEMKTSQKTPIIQIGDKITFEKRNHIPYLQDMRFLKGVPGGIEFKVYNIHSNGNVCMIADGFGTDKDYGNGSIAIFFKHLEENRKAFLVKTVEMRMTKEPKSLQDLDTYPDVCEQCALEWGGEINPEVHKCVRVDQLTELAIKKIKGWKKAKAFIPEEELSAHSLLEGKICGIMELLNLKLEDLKREE